MSHAASQAPDQKSAGQAPPKKRRGCLFWLAFFFGVFLLLALLTAGALWYVHRLATTRPEFWNQRDQMVQKTPPVELERIASEAEQYVGNTLTGPRHEAGIPSRVELDLTFDQINAWLNSRFPNWAAHQGFKLPPQIKGTMITQSQGDLLFSVDVSDPTYTGAITLRFDINVVDPGDAPGLVIRLDSIASGELPVSMSLVQGLFASDASGHEETRKWLELLRQGYRFPASAVLDPKTGRKLRLEQLQITPEGIKAVMSQSVNQHAVTTDPAKTEPTKAEPAKSGGGQ